MFAEFGGTVDMWIENALETLQICKRWVIPDKRAAEAIINEPELTRTFGVLSVKSIQEIDWDASFAIHSCRPDAIHLLLKHKCSASYA